MLVIHCFLGQLAITLWQIEAGARNIDEFLAIVFTQRVHQPRIDAVGQQQHLEVALAQLLEMRARYRGRVTFRENVVDLVLSILHARNIVLEGLVLRIFTGVRRGEAQQPGELLLAGGVLNDALLENLAELVPELAVVIALGELR